MLPTIRTATTADFLRLDELERACPMVGDTSLFIYRQGDYTRILRFFTRAHMWVAEYQDRLIGSISWSWNKVSVNGKQEPVGWLADVRVHPDFRKTRLIYRLLRQAYDQACADGVDLTIGTILKGNQAIEVLASGRAGFPRFEQIGTFDILQLYPGLPVRRRLAGLELRPANADDVPTICRLLNRHYQHDQFWIEATPERLRHVIALAEGMRLDDYTLVFRKGQAVAVIHTWDQGSFKKPIVERYSPYLELVTRATRLLSHFTPLPGLPKPGGTLRYLWLRDLACTPGHEHDLARLIHWQYSNMKGGPYHFLMAAVQRGDKMERLYRGIFRTRVTLNMWAVSRSGRDVKTELAPVGKRLFHDNTFT
ncbi:MAG: GNAT family N-acetyltransferase [Fidelibacterota bacterium]|nr:MAG: GNAT family N-acetyltransferase [Candidatus Neomarinimicrobiota bacterium]